MHAAVCPRPHVVMHPPTCNIAVMYPCDVYRLVEDGVVVKTDINWGCACAGGLYGPPSYSKEPCALGSSALVMSA